ncbi:5-formyltetrahydrofolate cyclo-ligase [Ascidiimonas aurantiaca]|uniref:5-formyltetrahydrofolate cyclo-ligase n=1 Tax=Ascidiimonas aurantiaca TaxID=1685432 RepID=UPI0030EBC9FE
MEKNALREKYRTLRKSIDTKSRISQSIAIANQALKLPVWSFRVYHVFLTIEEQKEVDTSFLITILQGKDKEIAISRSCFESMQMQHFLLTDGTLLKKSKYHIPEPVSGIEIPVSSIDVVYVPLLAYDVKGNRIGYGKGFYDRFLSSCKASVIKVGLSFFEPEPSITDVTDTDMRLDYCVTPHKIYTF